MKNALTDFKITSTLTPNEQEMAYLFLRLLLTAADCTGLQVNTASLRTKQIF